MDVPKVTGFPNYENDARALADFVNAFEEKSAAGSSIKYRDAMEKIARRQQEALRIDLADLWEFDQDLCLRVEQNTKRYQDIIADHCDEFCRAFDDGVRYPALPNSRERIWDTLMRHRLLRLRQHEDTADLDPYSIIPAELRRTYQVRFTPRKFLAKGATGGSSTRRGKKSTVTAKPAVVPLRSIRSDFIGKLVAVQGIVTRCTNVQPLLQVATYGCDKCSFETFQVVSGRDFTPLLNCDSKTCVNNNTKGSLSLDTRASRFVSYQEIKLQEVPSEVPVGHIPRSITLRAHAEQTRQCKPGDVVTVHGIFLPAPFSGFAAIRAGLSTETYVEVHGMEVHKKTYNSFQLTPNMEREIERVSQDPDLIDKLSRSLAPEIWGHEQVKKALLLLMAGGVTRELKDGMKIRGDINILLMGDPGVAKSQLLKHITHVAPRCVYTTGKGSSGVGLTAAVMRDPVTREMTLEGGALVLADKGICCIDEFDKMEESDRTAIHEVMEQQTVSIAKAGITTTLNARTSILAAANPTFGRWRPGVSLEVNVGLPTALLSRFDLCFVLRDSPNEDLDKRLAKHVTYVHMNERAPAPDELSENKSRRRSKGNKDVTVDGIPVVRNGVFTTQFLRAYIAKARSVEPYIPSPQENPGLTNHIVASYTELRQAQNMESMLRASSRQRGFSERFESKRRFVTARALLSILRLAQALARLRMSAEVTEVDVQEATALLDAAREDGMTGGETADVGAAAGPRRLPRDRIFSLISSHVTRRPGKPVPMHWLETQVAREPGLTEHLEETLQWYEDENIIMVDRDSNSVHIM